MCWCKCRELDIKTPTVPKNEEKLIGYQIPNQFGLFDLNGDWAQTWKKP